MYISPARHYLVLLFTLRETVIHIKLITAIICIRHPILTSQYLTNKGYINGMCFSTVIRKDQDSRYV